MSNSHENKFSKRESIILYLLVAMLFGLFYGYYRSMMPYTYGDTAFLIEVVTNLSNGLPPTSEILAQNWAAIKLGFGPLAQYCQKGLVAGMLTTDPYNWLTSLHAYLILYLIAPFAKVFGALNAISFFMALAFAVIPFVAYSYLRKSGISEALSILGAAICILHPAWQISSGGQFYTDRFFIPFALLYVLNLHQYFNADVPTGSESRRYLLWATLFGVLGGLTSERNMLTVIVFAVAYALVVRTPIKKRVLVIGFAGLCFIYVYSYIHFMGGSADNASRQAGLFNWPSIVNAAKIPGVGEYLWFNLLLLALPAVFAPRIFIAVLPIVAINCMITMGGAEKNGWLTHYHSHYFGFLTAAFLIGISSSKDAFGGRLTTAIPKVLFAVLACIALSIMITVPRFYQGQSVYSSLWDYFGRAKVASSTRAQRAQFETIARMVPPGTTITTPEWGMAAWYLRGNKVNFFPLGVGSNEYIMAQAEGEMPNIKLFSAVRYGADAALANECIANVVSVSYREVSRVGSWVLFKKK